MSDVVDKATAWDKIAEKNAEIERLWAVNERLRDALKHIDRLNDHPGRYNAEINQVIQVTLGVIEQTPTENDTK